MPDTQVSSVSTVTAAYDQLARFALRPQLYFDAVADVRPEAQSHRGSSVVFPLWADMAAATTELTETSDVTSVALSDSTVTVTLREYGNVAQLTRKLEGTSYVNVVADAANIVGYNAGLSMDSIVRTVLSGGTNVTYGGAATSTATITAAMVLTAHNIRETVADLRAAAVMPFGQHYNFFVHPDVSVDLREETGAAGWVVPASYSDAQRIWNGEIGLFDGGRFIETPRAFIDTDGGVGNVDVYHVIAVGQQSLAKAYASSVVGDQPSFIIGPIVDKLRRFRPMGWYWLGGYAIYRQAALRRIEVGSSLGANV